MRSFTLLSRFSQFFLKKKIVQNTIGNEEFEEEFTVDPYNVVNKSIFIIENIISPLIKCSGGKAIDYDRLIKYFGCSKISSDLLTRFDFFSIRKKFF